MRALASRRVAVLAAVVTTTVGFGLATAHAFPNEDPRPVRGIRTGTFSNLGFQPSDGQGSDWMYVGFEIRIVGHAGGYQAMIQQCQDTVIPVAIADANIDETTGRIVVHWPAHSIVPPCTFEGTVDKSGLVGVITYADNRGSKVPIRLPRAKSFWD